MRVGSLFAGIGGFDLAAEWVWGKDTTVWHSEIDPYASAVFAQHFPNSRNVGDITTWEPDCERDSVDLICGGFPCQDISTAGRGAGIDGARSGLWRDYARVIRALRPSYVLVENVPALLGRGIDRVLGDLASLGYDAEWTVRSAASFGAPHLRRRIWIVAYPMREGLALRNVFTGVSGEEQRPEGGQASLLGDALWPVADTPSERWTEAGELRHDEQAQRLASGGQELAATDHGRQSGQRQLVHASDSTADGAGQADEPLNGGVGNQWAVEPDVGRVADGVPSRVDRLTCLGNAIVPQVAEWIFRQIQAHEEREVTA